LRDDTSGVATIEQSCEDRVCQGRYFDGSRLYTVDYNDVPFPLDSVAPVERSVAAVVGFAYTSAQFTLHGGTIERAGAAELRVAARGAPPVAVALDPTTGLPHTIAYDGHTLVTFGDYRRVGALTLPFLIRRVIARSVTMSGGSIRYRWRYRTRFGRFSARRRSSGSRNDGRSCRAGSAAWHCGVCWIPEVAASGSG